MKKVLLTAVAAIALTTATHAASPFSGFYLGGGLAYNSNKATNKLSGSNPVATAWNKNGSGSNASFLAFMGYGHVFGSGMYLGGELTLGVDSTAKYGTFKNEVPVNIEGLRNNMANGTAEGTMRSKRGVTAEIAARLGYVFCNKTLVYGKIGFASLPKLEIEYKDTLTGRTVKQSARRSGFVMGAGVEHALTNNWLVRGEYKYNFGAKSTAEHMVNGAKSRQEVKTSSHTVMLGVAYKF